VAEDLNKIRNIIETRWQKFWNKMHSYLKEDMFALCALDMAYNDLYAKRKKLYEYWNYTTENNPLTDYTGLLYNRKMVSKMKELPGHL
jgi:L-alanine-DL-glutamate epimerase-like enolase superfamily enzyme